MRVVMPAGTVQTSGSAQIIQTHLMPQAMIKQGAYLLFSIHLVEWLSLLAS